MNNYAEETQPLFKLLRTPAFRFVVVRFNHYSLVRRLQSDLLEQFPDRKGSTINTEKATYEEILKAYLEQEEGFFFLENFEDILKRNTDSQGKVTPEMAKNNQRRSSIAAGMNMRRDKLAQSPIAIIAFVFPSAGELYARSLMEKMPDLWSFRSLLLDLKLEQEEQVVSMTDFLEMQPKQELMNVSTLGGLSKEEKLAELDRLLAQVKETPATETNYLKTLYEQIANLQKETGKYDEAIKTIDYLLENTNELDKQFWLQINKGDLLRNIGLLENTIEIYNDAKELVDESDKTDFFKGIALQRLGSAWNDLGDINKSLTCFDKALTIFQRFYEAYPENEEYKYGLAISYSKLGKTHASLGNLDKALQYFEERSKLTKELYEAYPKNVDFKNGLAISYSKLGDTRASLGNLDKALQYFEERSKLTKELYEAFPQKVQLKKGLAISCEKLGQTHASLGNLDKALQCFEDFLNLTKELYEAYPKNVDFKNGLAISYAKLGVFHRHQRKDSETAKTYFQQAQQLWEELVTTSPQNAEFKKNFANVNKELAELP